MNLEELIKQLQEHKRVYGGFLEVRFKPKTGETEWINSANIDRMPNGQIVVMID